VSNPSTMLIAKGNCMRVMKAKRGLKWRWITLLVILLWPALFYVLGNLDHDRGALWLLLFQMYYLPFGSWISQPFFVPDSELSYIVRVPGAILASMIYTAAYLGGLLLRRKKKDVA
jgi:hypothetical protein